MHYTTRKLTARIRKELYQYFWMDKPTHNFNMKNWKDVESQ